MEERIELIRLLAIGILSIAVLHGGTYALGQTTCSVTHPESRGSQDSNENSVTRHLSGGNMLSGLIEERLSLMTDVARAKWNSGSAIEDPIREQQLLDGVAVKAQMAGISAEWAQHFVRIKSRPLKKFNIASSPSGPLSDKNHFTEVQGLQTGIRPRLDRLTVELLQELSRQWPELRRSGLPEQNDVLSKQSTNEIATHLALLPLLDGSLQLYGHVRAAKSR